MEAQPPPPSSGAPLTVAALDLGSNSFHMVIARAAGHGLHMLDRLREPVRLADGLDADGMLNEVSQKRAMECLERIGQRLRNIARDHVRVVGTNTLRRARNGLEFRLRAAEALGHRVEVISGQEEARLIYLGVSHSLPATDERRLVVDIGGGSTEVILGEGFEVLHGHSLYMGCVTYSRTYFPGGDIRREAFRIAETAAGLEFRAIERRVRSETWEVSIDASGTINAIADILAANDLAGEAITLQGMKKLRKILVRAGNTRDLDLEGLRPDRAPVLAGGLAILIGTFKSLGIESMIPSAGALREGVLYDLLGRIRHEDVRDRTIRELVERYNADQDHALRVRRTALAILDQLQDSWEFDRAQARKTLTWASKLHEIGLALSYTGHHKHGAYLVTHADMPGFATDDQLLLAALVRGHRRKLPLSIFARLPETRTEHALRLAVIFRLAVLLNRSRNSEITPVIEAGNDWDTLAVRFPDEWLDSHPLTVADLEQERRYLGSVGIDLQIVRDAGADPTPER